MKKCMLVLSAALALGLSGCGSSNGAEECIKEVYNAALYGKESKALSLTGDDDARNMIRELIDSSRALKEKDKDQFAVMEKGFKKMKVEAETMRVAKVKVTIKGDTETMYAKEINGKWKLVSKPGF